VIAPVSAFLSGVPYPLHFSTANAISIVLYYLATSLVRVVSVENSNLQRGLMQSLKETVHPAVVTCLTQGRALSLGLTIENKQE